MDSHDIFRNRHPNVLENIKVPTCVVGIESDVLYPLYEQVDMYNRLGSCWKEMVTLKSEAGHDAFLLEQVEVGRAVRPWVEFVENGVGGWGGDNTET